jgi:polysaccharide chain length determinant protein (PEP-CTERM system associated)
MSDPLHMIVVKARGAWRFRWAGIVVAWVVAIAGWVGAALVPNTYEATARIYVDSATVLQPLLTGLAVGTDVQAQATMMSRVMLARPNLEHVARETGLHLRAKTAKDLENMVNGLGTRIVIASSQTDRNLYTIKFTDTDAAMSQRVVQTMLDAFVENTLGIKRTDSTEAQAFLEQQIRDYEERLRVAEDRLAAFKQRNVGLMPGQAGGYYERLQAALQRLEVAQAEHRTAASKREELLRQLEGEEPTVGLGPSVDGAGSGGTNVDAQISSLRAQQQALLVRYTEKHPQVVALAETIALLEKQRDEELEARRRMGGVSSPSGVNSLNINPVYQSMRIALSQTELQLVELRNRVATEQSEVSKLRNLVGTAPEVEAELVRLNRDYEVNRAQHQQLMQRLESARLSEDAATSKEQMRFRIIEPPVVPLQPSGPNRLTLDLVVLLLAIGGGAAVAFLLHQLRPVYSSRQELEAALGLPVLGTVTFSPGPAIARALARQPWLVGAAAALLLVAFVAAVQIDAWLWRPVPGG